MIKVRKGEKQVHGGGKINYEVGITLISLVVTIIVLLILAGVTVMMIAGDNGILNKATESTEETRGANVEEVRDLWKINQKADNYTENKTEQTLEELIDDLVNQKLLTENEKDQILGNVSKGIEATYQITIGSKNISFSNGIESKSCIVTSSKQTISLDRTIKKADIIAEKPEYVNYEIIGIWNESDGEYKTQGSIPGKSGKLEIVGDINDTTFIYTLTDFMNGDEKFLLKVSIDGEEYIQELNVIQGDVVTYEEDFVGIEYNSGIWTIDENENYNNGIAKMTDTTEQISIFEFTYTGTGVELIARLNAETGYIIVNGGELRRNLKKSDGQEDFNVNVLNEQYKNLENTTHLMNICIAKGLEALNRGKYFYLDAIRVYR